MLIGVAEPDKSKVRTWTDRSGSFKVEAQFLGLKDGKIHLHKLNGVKIAVPVVKMAIEDIEYVEKVTGQSLDDEKPLSDIRRSTQKAKSEASKSQQPPSQQAGATIEPPKPQRPKGPEYDWFQFFLDAGVSPYQCERYAFNFSKDSMDEGILPDITAGTLRTLGLKEGDILRVMKHLDSKLNRKKPGSENTERPLSPQDSSGGLFSGPGGTLRNNTRKGRPAPAVQTNDVVDAEKFRKSIGGEKKLEDRSETVSSPTNAPAPAPNKTAGGFDDDAWDMKPSKQQPPAEKPSQPPPAQSQTSVPPSQSTLIGSMAELSLLSPPLQPTKTQPTTQQPQPVQQTQQMQQPQQHIQPQPTQQPVQVQQPPPQHLTGANSSFPQLNLQSTGAQAQEQQPPQAPSMPSYQNQPSFQQQLPQQTMPPRQRPQAPSAPPQNSFLPPPPRPLSAPQNASQNNNFGPPPLQPQLTGFQPSNQQLQLAPPGQSLNDMNQIRQQQYSQPQMYPQPTGFGQQNQVLGQFGGGIQPQQTGFAQPFQISPQQTNYPNQQPYVNGQQTGSPFADPRSQQQNGGFPLAPQPTGFQPHFQPSLQPQQTGSINSILPPALQPQRTGVNGFGNGSGYGQPPPPMPSIPQQPAIAPLQPQKTGPAPPVQFGVPAPNKLQPQPTGRRANLSQASKLISISLRSKIFTECSISTRKPFWILNPFYGLAH